MKNRPRNPVARAMRLAGKSVAAHGRSKKQERRREKMAMQRAIRQDRDVFPSTGLARVAEIIAPARNLGFC